MEEHISIITPYKKPLKFAAQHLFNFHHHKGRCIIEMVLWVDEDDVEGNLPSSPRGAFLFVPLVIASCSVLHICVGVGDVLSPADDERVEEEEGEEEREEIQGAFSGNTFQWKHKKNK